MKSIDNIFIATALKGNDTFDNILWIARSL